MVKKKTTPKIILPENFKDKALVARYNRLNKILSDYGIYEASDGSRISMLNVPHNFKLAIRHLPADETRLLEVRYEHFKKLKPALGSLRRKMNKETGEDFEGLLELRKTELLELFGRYYSPTEIHKRLIEVTGVDVSFSSVQKFALKYKLEIEKMQIDWSKDHASVAIGKKRSRLEELNRILRALKEAESRAHNDKAALPFIKEIRAVLEQARKEIEGHQIKLDVHGRIDINATIASAQSVEQMYAEINWMNLLIARVSARMGINPLLLNHQLTNSWYSKMTGIKKTKSLMDEKVDYPSKILVGLDWNELKARAEKTQEDYKTLKNKYTEEVEAEPTAEEKAAGERIRAMLREKIEKRNKALDELKNRLQG